MSETEDIKQRLKDAKAAVQKAREDQIQKQTQKENLEEQRDSLIAQIKEEFDLEPDKLEEHAQTLREDSEKLIAQVEEILAPATEEE